MIHEEVRKRVQSHAWVGWSAMVLASFAGEASAQGSIAWRSTHTLNGGYSQGSCLLAHAEARVVAHPGYLDVEEEVEIGAVGSVAAGVDAQTLELFGNFTLSPGSAIQGALLWNGEEILEAKLLDRKKADSLYEDVVDRNSNPPVRPRDPVVIEAMGNGVYQFKIYPVKQNHVRKLRIRYLVPAQGFELAARMPLRFSFSGLFPGQASQLSVKVTAGSGLESLQAYSGASARDLKLPAVLLLSTTDLARSQYTWLQPPGLRSPSFLSTHFEAGAWKGHYLQWVGSVPDAILYRYKAGRRVFARLKMGDANLELEAQCKQVNCEPLAFSGLANAAWSSEAVFSLLDESGETVLEETVKYANRAEAEGDSSVAVLWAASASPFSEEKLPPLGATYGFVDRFASLLALESDAMDEEKAEVYADAGVPRFAIQGVEVVLPDYDPDQILDPGSPNNPVVLALAPNTPSLYARSAPGGYEMRLPAEWAGREIELFLYDLHGRQVAARKVRVGEDGWIRLPGAGIRTGTYLVAIRAEGVRTARRLVLP